MITEQNQSSEVDAVFILTKITAELMDEKKGNLHEEVSTKIFHGTILLSPRESANRLNGSQIKVQLNQNSTRIKTESHGRVEKENPIPEYNNRRDED